MHTVLNAMTGAEVIAQELRVYEHFQPLLQIVLFVHNSGKAVLFGVESDRILVFAIDFTINTETVLQINDSFWL
jgi:hypothetical protein